MENRRILMCFLIVVALTIIRLSLWDSNEITSLRLMSAINSIAFDYILYTIYLRAYDEMLKLHNHVMEGNQNSSPTNRRMIDFKKKIKFLFTVLIITTTIYIAWGGHPIINDILTVLALILSIEDNAFSKALCKKNYDFV